MRQIDTCFVHTNTTVPAYKKIWIPVTVAFKSGYVMHTGNKGVVWINDEPVTDTRNIWKKQGWSIRTMCMPIDNGAGCVNDIESNNGKMVCNGSFKYGRSSSASLLISAHNFLGTNIVLGWIEDQSVYRGELGGILGSVITIKILYKQFGVTHAAVTIGVDCEGAIKACEGHHADGNVTISSVTLSAKCRIQTFVSISDMLPAIKMKLKLLTTLMNGKELTIELIDTLSMPCGSTWGRVVQE